MTNQSNPPLVAFDMLMTTLIFHLPSHLNLQISDCTSLNGFAISINPLATSHFPKEGIPCPHLPRSFAFQYHCGVVPRFVEFYTNQSNPPLVAFDMLMTTLIILNPRFDHF
jgi:hypothetical protein